MSEVRGCVITAVAPSPADRESQPSTTPRLRDCKLPSRGFQGETPGAGVPASAFGKRGMISGTYLRAGMYVLSSLRTYCYFSFLVCFLYFIERVFRVRRIQYGDRHIALSTAVLTT